MSNKHFSILLFFVSLFMFAQTQSNKLDDKGNKNGLWKGYYPETKNLKYEGTFEHGKEVGVFTFYDNTKTKTVIATREFNSKENSAYTIVYDPLKNKVNSTSRHLFDITSRVFIINSPNSPKGIESYFFIIISSS